MRIALFLIAALIGGCATVPTAPPPEQVEDAAAHFERLQRLAGWSLRGRAAISTPEQAGNLTVSWQQLGERYQIELLAPLGAGGVRLSGDGAGVRLRTADGEEAYAETPAELLERHTGYRLPVEALRYWLLGAPVPGRDAATRFGEQGLLDRLDQAGWTVDYRRYGQFGDIALPTKVFLSNDAGIELRLVVQDWELRP